MGDDVEAMNVDLVQTERGWQLEVEDSPMGPVMPTPDLLQHWIYFLLKNGDLTIPYRFTVIDRRGWRLEGKRKMES